MGKSGDGSGNWHSPRRIADNEKARIAIENQVVMVFSRLHPGWRQAKSVNARRRGVAAREGDHAALSCGSLSIMVSRDFLLQAAGYGLTTAAIHYRLPDHPSLLQLYVWQAYDVAPDFPTLRDFLHYWELELDGALHSVRVSHSNLVKPAGWRKIDSVITIQ